MKGGNTKAKAAANGKKVGRPAKPKIELKAGKGIASEVLAMDGPPDHTRKCDCAICAGDNKKKCECKTIDGLEIDCLFCRTREDHLICRCEHCAWWDLFMQRDKRIVLDSRRYLTDRRDGRPAQGMFVGDTRESERPLDRGNYSSLVGATRQSSGASKPN